MLRRTVELVALLFEAGGTFAMAIGAVVAIGLALRDRGGGGRMDQPSSFASSISA